MTRSNERRLRQQSWLLVGLVALMACSALLLWRLRASDARREGRAVRAGDAALSGADKPPPRTEAPARPSAEGAEPRVELAPEVLEAAMAPEADAFEADAVYGRTLVEGVPEPGVRVLVFPEETSPRDTRAPLRETTSDATGRFRLRGLEPHSRYLLLAQSEAVLPYQEALFPGEAHELELARAVTVAGTVRARDDGRALAGVELALTGLHWDGAVLAERVRTTSAADGSWRLPWAEVGMQSFLVLRPGRLSERREFQVTAEGGSNFEIVLDEELRLELLVVDLASGAPLAEVELSSLDGPVRTDARGILAVPVPSDGTRDEWVRVSLGHPGDARTEGRLKVGPLGGPRPRVPVARGGRVRGIVLDAAGAPVADAFVRLTGGARTPVNLGLPEGFSLGQPRGAVRSGADGRFELTGCVPRQGSLEVNARHPRHPQGRSAPFPFERLGQEQEVEIRLTPGASVVGLVTCDGAPLALTVQFESDERSGGVRSNAQGAFRIDGLSAGNVMLRPRREGDWDDSADPADREVLAVTGETVTCDLVLVADEVTIEGRVIDTQGAPVAGVSLVAYSELEDDEIASTSVESERDGSFVLALPPVTGRLFTVWAEKGPRQLQQSDVAPGTRGLELVLPNLARVAVRVRDALAREPVQGFRLYWRTSEGGSFRRLDQDGDRFSAGPDGRFQAELPVGRLDLVVAARHLGFLPAWHEGVNVLPERSAELDFELELGVELELVVNGEATLRNQLRRAFTVSGVQQALAPRGGDFYSQEIRGSQGIRPDERGSVRLRAMPPGEYSFERLPGNLRLTPASFELPAVAQQRLEFTLAPAESPDGSKPAGSGN